MTGKTPAITSPQANDTIPVDLSERRCHCTDALFALNL